MEHSRLTRAKRLSEVEKDASASRLKRYGLYGLIALAAAGILYLVGDRINSSLQAKSAVVQRARVSELIAAGPALFGQTRQEIYANLGQPVQIDDSIVRDYKLRKGWEQIIYKIRYNGVFLEVQRLRTPGEPERETLSQIGITSREYKLAYELGVGMHKSRVRSILGAPTREEPGKDVYQENGVFQKQIRFLYTGDTVTAIEWRF
jgi:hypothetical protein